MSTITASWETYWEDHGSRSTQAKKKIAKPTISLEKKFLSMVSCVPFILVRAGIIKYEDYYPVWR
jgi:hypothetical protein